MSLPQVDPKQTPAPVAIEPPNRKFLALCGAGAFVLFAGLALPRLLVDTPNPETTVKTVESGAEKVKPSIREGAPRDVEAPKGQEPPSLTGILTRLMIGTFVVLALCGGTAWGVAKWVRGQQKSQSAGPLKFVATLTVNRSVAVHLVRVGDREILLGTDSSGLRSMLPLGESFEETLKETQIQEAHGIPLPRVMQ